MKRPERVSFAAQLNAEAAWQQAFEAIAQDYRALPDEYLRARAADVVDVGQRVLRQLLGVALPSLDLDRPAIIIARDLTPSDTARLDAAKVLGICTELGGATAHSAILARSLGIPAVVALNGTLRDVVEGQIIALDGTTGTGMAPSRRRTISGISGSSRRVAARATHGQSICSAAGRHPRWQSD